MNCCVNNLEACECCPAFAFAYRLVHKVGLINSYDESQVVYDLFGGRLAAVNLNHLSRVKHITHSSLEVAFVERGRDGAARLNPTSFDVKPDLDSVLVGFAYTSVSFHAWLLVRNIGYFAHESVMNIDTSKPVTISEAVASLGVIEE